MGEDLRAVRASLQGLRGIGRGKITDSEAVEKRVVGTRNSRMQWFVTSNIRIRKIFGALGCLLRFRDGQCEGEGKKGTITYEEVGSEA